MILEFRPELFLAIPSYLAQILLNTTFVTVINNKPEMDLALDLKVGEIATIRGFSRRDMASKLLVMGVLPGSSIEVIRKSPFGGSYYVAIDTHFLALRLKEIQSILIQK